MESSEHTNIKIYIHISQFKNSNLTKTTTNWLSNNCYVIVVTHG